MFLKSKCSSAITFELLEVYFIPCTSSLKAILLESVIDEGVKGKLGLPGGIV